jgi:hypothetical protein
VHVEIFDQPGAIASRRLTCGSEASNHAEQRRALFGSKIQRRRFEQRRIVSKLSEPCVAEPAQESADSSRRMVMIDMEALTVSVAGTRRQLLFATDLAGASWLSQHRLVFGDRQAVGFLKSAIGNARRVVDVPFFHALTRLLGMRQCPLFDLGFDRPLGCVRTAPGCISWSAQDCAAPTPSRVGWPRPFVRKSAVV